MKKIKLPLMKKVVGAVMLLGMLATDATAQTAASYSFTAAASTFVPTTGGTVVPGIVADDANSGTTMLNIGFTFNFCGTNYTQFKACSNGWLTFGNSTSNQWLSTQANCVFQPAIMPFWDDLEGGSGVATSNAFYVVTGAFPNRVMTIEWLNYGCNFNANTPVISVQCKLYETTNVIEFYYRQEAGAIVSGSTGGNSAAIGIAATTTDFKMIDGTGTAPTASSVTFFDALTGKPATGQMYRFTPPPPPPCTGNPTVSGATSSVTSANCSATPSLNLTTFPGNVTGITYQWQASPAGQNTWTNIGVASASPAFTAPTITSSTDYQIIATCGSTGGGSTTVGPVAVTVAKPTVSPTTATICATNGQPLAVTIPSFGTPTTILTENFNGGTLGGFTNVNTTTGGTNNAAANWTVQPSGHNPGQVLTPPTATQFVISNSDATSTTAGPVVHTELISPVINTTGYSTLSLNFNHYLRTVTGTVGTVQVTTNGTSWTTVATYNTTQGTNSAFATAAPINLNAYVNQPNFQFRFVYDAGWHWWWAIDDIALSGIPTQTVTWSASPSLGAGLPAGSTVPNVANANITVTPTVAGTFVYTATTSACGSVASTITVNPAPTAAFTMTADSVCENTSATLNLTGTAGAAVTFFDGTSNQTVILDGVGTGSYTTPALAVGSHTYSLVTVQGTSCTVNATGSIVVQATPLPTAMLTSIFPTAICNGTSANVGVAAISSYTWPATIHYTNGVSTGTYSTGNNSANIPVSPSTGTYTYSIDYIEDAQGCASAPGTTPGTAVLTVNPSPSATITASAPSVCSGAPVTYTVNLTGTGPWDVQYTDGVNAPVDSNGLVANSFTFTTNPTVDETYSFNSLSDASGCAALAADFSSTATVTIGSPATVTDPISTATLCTGSSASFSVTSTGLNVSYQWLANGVLVANGGVYSGANSNTLMISNVAGLNGVVYKAIANGQCGIPDTSNNGATLNVTAINTWSGAINNDWNTAGNWSCGAVPVITTDVMIPDMANDPIVMNFPTALGNTLTIDPNASVTVNFGYELQLNSTITNNGNFDLQSGKLILSGPGTQNIPSGMYLDLEVNGGGIKILDGDATVDNVLTLTNGWIQLNNFDLTLGAPESTVGGSNLSYIITNGTGVVTGINMDAADSVTFHVGNANYNALGMRNNGVGDNFSVRVADAVYQDGDGSTSTNSVTFPVANATWFLTEAIPGGSDVTMSPHYYIGQGINGFDNNHVFVVHHDGTMWEALADSTVVAPIAGGLNPYYATATNVTSFSPFAVGSGSQFPLSVTLSDIAATNVGAHNRVDWSSATEGTGVKYELQRSIDGKNFIGIATISAKGEASSYTYWDAKPATGINYYRVKLVDLDGKYGYSKIVSATVGAATAAFSVDAYPNPVSSVVTVKVNGTMSGDASVVLTDVTGKVIKSAKLDSDKLNINLGDIASGIYFIKYSDDVHHESIKINKQ